MNKEIKRLSDIIEKTLNKYENDSIKNAKNNGDFCCDLFYNDIINKIASSRFNLCKIISDQNEIVLNELEKIENIFINGERIKGMFFDYSYKNEEKIIIKKAQDIFNSNWKNENSFNAFVIISLHFQPFNISLQKNIYNLSNEKFKQYISYIIRQPHIMCIQDEISYIKYYKDLVEWICILLDKKEALGKEKLSILIDLIHKKLTFGTACYLDIPIGDIVKLRAKIVKKIAPYVINNPTKKIRTKKSNKIRIGIISRNLGDYTDTKALYCQFNAFDKSKYEFFWYSLENYDRATKKKTSFTKKLDSFINKKIILKETANEMMKQILDDNLDILYVGSAFSFGAKPMDVMLSYKLADIQILPNMMIPSSSGFDSYDYLIVTNDNKEAINNFKKEAIEEIITIKDPLLWYEKPEKVKHNPKITRKAFSIPDDAIIYCSAAAANKQMSNTINTWLNILDKVPNSYIIFCPFNPAWGGYYIGLTFLSRLRSELKKHPKIDKSRIIIIREMSVEETENIISMIDIYLGSFPHAGATLAMTALNYNKLLIARKTKWLRSTSDQSYLKTLELHELIGKNNEEVTKIGIKLGLDKKYFNMIKLKIENKMKTAPFFDIYSCSKNLESVFKKITSQK